MTDALRRAGELAVEHAAKLWAYDIIDPKRSDETVKAELSRAHIDTMLRDCGWTWEIPYKGDGQVEWCGIFAGSCWKAAGLDPTWLRTYFASTYRLDLWARYRVFDAAHPNPKPTVPEHRVLVELTPQSTAVPVEVRPGDILMIGDGTPSMGDHICIVASYDEQRRVFNTIEGNGVGLGPDGKRRQGVVRGERILGGLGYCARRLIRPAFGDLLAERGD